MVLFTIIVLAVVLGIILLATKTNTSNSTAPIDLNLNPSPSPMLQTSPQQNQPTPPSSAQTSPLPSISPISATRATISTAKGDIVVEFYPQDAPKTVTNFATLAKSGFYNGLSFHRVEPGFVIQGGDPKGDGTGGTSIYGSTFEDELNPETQSYKDGYKEGVLAMANRGPNTNSSQFFIMLADNDTLPKNYTIFGKVTSGMDVVKKIVVGDKMTKVTVE